MHHPFLGSMPLLSPDLFPFMGAGVFTLVMLLVSLLLLLALVLKGLALWFSARNDQKIWFVIFLIVNTFGILEIVYLTFFRPKDKPAPQEQVDGLPVAESSPAE